MALASSNDANKTFISEIYQLYVDNYCSSCPHLAHIFVVFSRTVKCRGTHYKASHYRVVAVFFWTQRHIAESV